MKIRIYPRVPGVRPMLFSDVSDVVLDKYSHEWTLEFNHTDHINKDRKVNAHSQFSSSSAMAYTVLYEENDI